MKLNEPRIQKQDPRSSRRSVKNYYSHSNLLKASKERICNRSGFSRRSGRGGGGGGGGVKQA